MIQKDEKTIELNVKGLWHGLPAHVSMGWKPIPRMGTKYLFAGFIVCFALVSGVFASDSNDFSSSRDALDQTASADVNAVQVQDLEMKGNEAITYQYEEGKHIVLFQNGFSMTANQTEFSSEQAVIWLVKAPENSSDKANYIMTGYLQGNVRLRRDGRAVPNIDDTRIAVWCRVAGDVFVTADKKVTSDPRGMKLYATAYNTLQSADISPAGAEAMPVLQGGNRSSVSVVQAGELGGAEKEEKPKFRYPITLQPISEKGFEIEVKNNFATVMGGFYLSQKQEFDGKTLLLEMQANDAVIFLPGSVKLSRTEMKTDANEPNDSMGIFDKVLASGTIDAIYMSGNVVMTEGQRTVRADEIYYDYKNKKAIIINAVMRNFDINKGIPIYVRASKLLQLAENKFSAKNAILTTSEFYIPQISLGASSIVITDNTSINQQEGKETNNSYEVEMHGLSLNYYDAKIPLFIQKVSANMERPDSLLKKVRAGNDNILGTYVESSWYTTRLLGLEEPEGTDSTLLLDYYSKRGPGGGIETNYSRDNYYGKFSGYIINDHGEDQLGRAGERRNLEPPDEMRGRVFWQNRQFLPYKWQLTTEISYLSDEHFLESFYRNEYYLEKPPETLIHAKRIQDNWGLSLLAKIRINSFENVLEEMPTAQFHLTGQSFLDDRLTFYSDNQVSRLRQLYADGSTETEGNNFFTFMTTRNEVDLPLFVNKVKVVPFAALTAAYEDDLGFYRTLDNNITGSEDDVLIGEFGVRGSMQPFWKVFPDVNSQLLDLYQLRHVIQPHFIAVDYIQNHSVAEQRDVLNVGITQRLQTKRGSGSLRRTVNWMRLDTDITWVKHSSGVPVGADQFIWDKPFIPLFNEESTLIPQQDRRTSVLYGPRHNYFSANYVWNMSDSTAFLSDMYYDLHESVLQQMDFGFSHMRQPDLSYYFGTRYLRNIDTGDGENSMNAFTYALTYILDPRYSLVYSGQLDFDSGAAVRNDIALIRRYHRLFWSISYSSDESLRRQSIAFSIWPQGVPQLAFGPSRYMDLGGSAGF